MIKSAQHSDEMFSILKDILIDPYYSDKSILFLPINDCDFNRFGGIHWSLIVFYKNKSGNCKFEHYDSLNGFNYETASTPLF